VAFARQLRFFAHTVLTPSFACVIALVLLLPSFFVLGSHNPAGAPLQIPSASAQVPPSSTPDVLTNYKNIGVADPGMSVLVSVAIPLRNLALLSSLVK
jgi:hypothetical protein